VHDSETRSYHKQAPLSPTDTSLLSVDDSDTAICAVLSPKYV